MPPEQFARLVGARHPEAQAMPRSDPLLSLLQPLREHASSLSRYCGYYFEYANCMSVPGSVLISLVHLREEDGLYLFERQERQRAQARRSARPRTGFAVATWVLRSACRTACS